MARSAGIRAFGWSVAAAGLVGLAAATLWQGGAPVMVPEAKASEPVSKPAQPVRVMVLAATPAFATSEYIGTVRPRHEAALGFRMAGKLVQRLVDPGDVVKAGQVLAVLDDTDARLALDQALAEVQAATIDLSRAEAELERSLSLRQTGFLAQAALDRAKSAEAEARARLDRATKTRTLAENQVSYTTLQAQTDGIVTATPAEPGQVVQAGQSIVTLARLDTLEVQFPLPEHKRGIVQGATATARLWGDDARSYPLTLREVAPDVDPVSRTYRVRMEFVAPDDRITLGRTVTVQMSAPVPATLQVPLAAVLNDGQGAAVWRLDAGGTAVTRVAVEVQAFGPKLATIRGPVQDGDRIVALGAQKIDLARPVRVVETATPVVN